MLALSRKTGEELIIGGNVRIVFKRISSGRVVIAIEAPDDVRIVRGELLNPTENANHATPKHLYRSDAAPLRSVRSRRESKNANDSHT